MWPVLRITPNKGKKFWNKKKITLLNAIIIEGGWVQAIITYYTLEEERGGRAENYQKIYNLTFIQCLIIKRSFQNKSF